LFSFRHPFTIIRKYNGGSSPKKEDGEKKNPKPGQTRFWIWAKKKIKIKKNLRD